MLFALVGVVLIKRHRRKRERGEAQGPVRSGKDLTLSRPAPLAILSKNCNFIPTASDPVPVRVKIAAKAKGDRLWMAYRRCVAFDYLYLGNELMLLSDIQLEDVFVVLGIKRPPRALLAPLKTVGARFKATELSTASDEAQLEDVVDFLFSAIPDVLVEHSIDCLALHTAKKQAAKQKKREEREERIEKKRLRAELPLSAPVDGIVADGDEAQYADAEALGISEDEDEDEDDLYEDFYAMIEDYRPAENDYLVPNPRGCRGLLPDAADRSVEEVDPLYWDVDHLSDDHLYDDMQTLQRNRMQRNEGLFQGTPWDLGGDARNNDEHREQYAGDNATDYRLNMDDEPPSSFVVDIASRRSSVATLRQLSERHGEGPRDLAAYARMEKLRSEHDEFLDSRDYGARPVTTDDSDYGNHELLTLRRAKMNPEETYGLRDEGSDSDDDYGRGEYLDSSDYASRPAAVRGNGLPETERDYGLSDSEEDYYGLAEANEGTYGLAGANEGTCGLPDYAEHMAAKEHSPRGLPDYSAHMLAVDHRDAVDIEPLDTDDFYVMSNSTERFSFGDKSGLGEAGDITCDLQEPGEPAGYDLAVEGLRGLECAHGDEEPEQHAYERADGFCDDDQFPIPSQPGGQQIVYLDSMDLEADLEADARPGYITCLADGENAPAYAVPRTDAEPTYVYASELTTELNDDYVIVDPGPARGSFESPCAMVSEAEHAVSPTSSSATEAVSAAGEDAIYAYADGNDAMDASRSATPLLPPVDADGDGVVPCAMTEWGEQHWQHSRTDLSAAPLRGSAPSDTAANKVAMRRNTLREVAEEATYDTAAATVTVTMRRNTLRDVPDEADEADEATYEYATLRRETPSTATPVTRGSMQRQSTQRKRTKATPDAPVQIGGKRASRRWSKDQKRKKSLVPDDPAEAVQSSRDGGLEAVSIRLNKETDGEHVNPTFSGPVAVARQQSREVPGKEASKAGGRRWSKDQKRKKSLVPPESDTAGGFEAVSIRLTKGAGSVDDFWGNGAGKDVNPAFSGPVAAPRQPRQPMTRNYSRKLTFTGRSMRKAGINTGPGILDLDASTDQDEPPEVEDGGADWDDIQTFLTAVAATTAAEAADTADTTAPTKAPRGILSPSMKLHNSNVAGTPAGSPPSRRKMSTV